MKTAIKYILFLAGFFALPLGAQDTFEVKRPNVEGKAQSTVAKTIDLYTKTAGCMDPNKRKMTSKGYVYIGRNENERLCLEQEPDTGNVHISFIDKIANTKETILLTVKDNYGYNQVKGFLKKVNREYDLEWYKYKSYMNKKKKQFLSGQPVKLEYTVLTAIPVKNGVLEFGFKPWYQERNAKELYAQRDVFFRIRDKKGKTQLERIMWDYQYTEILEFFTAALKYQLELEKK